MSNITFILFTYNEEKRIAYAVRNFVKYGSVIILDGGSTDRTQEISEKLGAKFFTRPDISKPQVETTENFEFIKKHSSTDWFYWGYVDNFAPKSLVEKFVDISKQDTYKMVLVPLYTYLWGDTKRYAQKSYSPFLFHKDFIEFSKNYIHGMGQFTGTKKQVLRLPNKSTYALRHFSTYNVNKFVTGYTRYANQEAIEKYNAGKKFSFIRMIGGMLRYFWIYGKLGCRNGTLGFIISLNFAFSRLIAYTRLYELEHDITLDSIEKEYSKSKEALLKDF